MQANQTPVKKIGWFFPLLITSFGVMSLSSCKGKENNKEKAPEGSCITLSSAKIKKGWESPGHLKNISYLKFITYYNSVTNEIQVSVQAYSKEYKTVGSLIKLATGAGCDLSKIPPVSISDNYETLAHLGILDSLGGLKDFEYITLTPRKDDKGYLFFQTGVFSKGGNKPRIMSLTGSVPCPPCKNCIPPCPIECTPPCSTQDSMESKVPPYNFVDPNKTQ